MIQHVYERVVKAKVVPYVAVATDDEEYLTLWKIRRQRDNDRHHTSLRHGQDAEAVKSLNLSTDAIVVNIQGDQPIFEPARWTRSFSRFLMTHHRHVYIDLQNYSGRRNNASPRG